MGAHVDVSPISMKDLIEAMDKLADLTKKLSGMLRSAIDRGAELIEWNHARQLKNNLSDFLAGTIELRHSSNVRLVDLLADPALDSEHFVARLDTEIIGALASVMILIADLEKVQRSVASKEFYELMVATLRGRETLLFQMHRFLRREHQLFSNSDSQQFCKFESRYRQLRAQLIQANKILAAYIESIQDKNAWPKVT